ncbi:MAG: site-specific DNA-methyltransferase, partial [Ruminococcus sp.]|nr:site-specific DNA-methyltransferase [Ruminococcus sp.]
PAKAEKGMKAYSGCYHIKGMNTRKKHHQTEKPVELLEKLIQISPEDGTVLDCFMGSGSTGVACMNTNRNFIGIELSENYFSIAQNRIKAEH